MAREQYLRGVDLEELRKPQDPPPPMTFKQKLENFWYNYKIPVIIGVAVIVVAVILGVMIASREKADYQVVLVTKGTVGQAGREEFAQMLEKYGKDLDGDGQVNVQLIQLSMTDPGDSIEFQTILSGGTAMFICIEPDYYDAQFGRSKDVFVKLDVTHPGLSEDGTYWNWADSDEQVAMGGGYPKNIYFAVRRPTGTAAGHEQESADCKALLEALIRNTLMAD